MKIKYLGHSCFMIITKNGVKIITDPYLTGTPWPPLTYGEIKESADVVTISHDHKDHSNVASIHGSPRVLKGRVNEVIKGVEFKSIHTYHDNSEGTLKGDNAIFIIKADGITVCHLGDLGHLLNQVQIVELGTVDILFVPAGGFYTIEADIASRLCDLIGPRVVIPMHYKTNKLTGTGLESVDKFLDSKEGIKKTGTSEIEFTQSSFIEKTQIIVLESAL